ILQKSFIEVDEIGTEATAFTMLLQTGGGAPPPQQPPSFVADHLFMFMIREDVSPTGIWSNGMEVLPPRQGLMFESCLGR
ncbi:serpin-ZX, partial [Tanacetum coccineum]